MKRSAVGSNSQAVRVTFLTLLVLVSITVADRLVNTVAFNLANVILNRTLWQDGREATYRQQMLSWAAMLLETAHGEKVQPDDGVAGGCSMIPAIAVADYHRRQEHLEEAVVWLRRAAEADPLPAIQQSIILPRSVSIDQEGNIVLDWAGSWRFRSDSQTADLAMDREQHWLSISYENTPGHRDKVIYQWVGPLHIPYWHTLQLEARLDRGTFLTVETHSHAGVERHINYHQGSGEWEEFVVSLSVDELRWVYVSLNEPSAESFTPVYRADIKPLTLLVDEPTGGRGR